MQRGAFKCLRAVVCLCVSGCGVFKCLCVRQTDRQRRLEEDAAEDVDHLINHFKITFMLKVEMELQRSFLTLEMIVDQHSPVSDQLLVVEVHCG